MEDIQTGKILPQIPSFRKKFRVLAACFEKGSYAKTPFRLWQKSAITKLAVLEDGMKTIITYGTFDLFHEGHLNILLRARQLGDRLIVGVSTDAFNQTKNKKSVFSFEQRRRILAELRCVDAVFPEENWDQKTKDIQTYGVSTFVMGDDWAGKFDFLAPLCEVIYLPRTEGVSSTDIKRLLYSLSAERLKDLEQTFAAASSILASLG